jgi:transposase
MADGVQGITEVEPVRDSVARRRRRWSAREKAQIVEEAQRPGAMLQEVAQRHGLHPSLLTRWRAQYRTVRKKAARREVRLLPVTVEPRTRPGFRLPRTDSKRENAATLGTIEVEFSAGWRLHIQGMVDAATLRTLLQELARS